ncbi:MAG TPA: hypothetical protein VLA51_13960, partial [Paracoccaceae bacterium]|nr:hypothetical protein [Paracoccaceae bacterium]
MLSTAYHAQDIGTGSLAHKRCLSFIEEAYVLDGDHGLIAERLGDRDLFSVKGAGRIAHEHQHAKALLAPQQRQSQCRARPAFFKHFPVFFGQVCF